MSYLSTGVLLLIGGGALAVTGLPLLIAPGWATITLGAVLVVAHMAVGPTRAA